MAIPGSMFSVWFVYLRSRLPLMTICYLFGLFILEPGIHLWLYVISLVCLSQNQVSPSSFMLSLCLDQGYMNITSSISF